jgi:hypothetical protein
MRIVMKSLNPGGKMSRLFASMLFAACVPAFAGAAPVAPFDPAAHKLQAGRINEVMVLGTPHLTQLPRSFDPAQLSLLHARLLAWRPQAIAIEALSGLQCAYLRSYPQRYADTIKSYCWDPCCRQAATAWMWWRLPCRRSACWPRGRRRPRRPAAHAGLAVSRRRRAGIRAGAMAAPSGGRAAG